MICQIYDGLIPSPVHNEAPITTAGLAGGLHRPYKGLLPAAPVRVHEAAANRTYFPPAAKAAIFSWAFLPAHP